MIQIICDGCSMVIDKLRPHKYSTNDYLDYWRKPDSHLCKECYIKHLKRQYELEHKNVTP